MSLEKNVAASVRVAKDRNVRAKPGQCYANAFRVVLHVPEYAGATYVEGMAVLKSGLVIEHGWVEHQGEVIDPTLPEEPVAYFPGLRFEGAKGIAKALAIPKPDGCDRDLPIFSRFGWGADSPEFCKARE